MKIESFLICDAATDYNGKLNILGAYDTIVAKEQPIKVQTIVFALRLRFFYDETGNHDITINTIDYDGKPVFTPFKVSVQIQVPQGRDSVAVNLIIRSYPKSLLAVKLLAANRIYPTQLVNFSSNLVATLR